MTYTLQQERAVVLGKLITKWSNRAIENPSISTHDLLNKMSTDCNDLIISDF